MERRRNRGLELGVILLFAELLNVGFDKIPPVTLLTILGQVLLYIGVINVPWNKWDVCISAEAVIKHRDYKRLFLSIVEHGSDMHLYYNMISFLLKGRSLERRYGSTNFAFLLIMISTLTSAIYIGLGMGLANVLHDKSYMHSCAIGFSGVIFALKVLTTSEVPLGSEYISGMRIPKKYAVWAELLLIQVLVPNASFIGHLAGILAGLVYTSTTIGRIMDEFIVSVTGEPINHYRHTPHYGWNIN